MFTGIVTDVGEIVEMTTRGRVARLTVACRYDVATVDVGASVANAGVCLTVVEARRAATARRSPPTSAPRRSR